MYGKGKSWRKQETERLFKLLIIKQILMERVELNGMGFPVTYVKIGSRSSLPNSEKIMLTITSEDDSSLSKTGEKGKTRRSLDLVAADLETEGSSEPALQMECYKELRQFRDELAESNELDPSQVFKDSTILAMSQMFPTSMEEFRDLPGVNEERCDMYAGLFMEITQRYSDLMQGERARAAAAA
jgi:superfamily II DNA helicase RecQ